MASVAQAASRQQASAATAAAQHRKALFPSLQAKQGQKRCLQGQAVPPRRSNVLPPRSLSTNPQFARLLFRMQIGRRDRRNKRPAVQQRHGPSALLNLHLLFGSYAAASERIAATIPRVE